MAKPTSSKGKKKKKQLIDVKLPKCRIAFMKIWKPESYQGGDPKYSAVFLIPKKLDISEIRKAIIKTAVKAFGEDYADRKNWAEGAKYPIRDGDKKKGDLQGFKGCWYITANSKFKPGVVRNDEERSEIREEDGEIKSGDYVRALLTADDFDVSGNHGVKFYLQGIQKMADGEAFGGGARDLSAEFDHVEDEDGDDGDDDSEDDDKDDEDDDY